MMRGALLAAMLALLPAPIALAQPARDCPDPPALDGAPKVPDSDDRPNWDKREHALEAQQAWAAPRVAYAACARRRLAALADQANDATKRANALIDQWNALDAKVREAGAIEAGALKAFSARRGGRALDAPAPPMLAPLTPPCAPAPSADAAPPFPEAAHASVKGMSRAETAFQAWLAPRAAYLSCLKAEGAEALKSSIAAQAEYDDARKAYGDYRSAFNDEVKSFATALAGYTRKLRAAEAP